MKIDTSKISQLLNNYDKKAKTNQAAQQENEQKDKVAVSDQALQVQKGKQAYEELPDLREDKVAELKEQIRSGSYDVSGEEIAGAMLDSVIDQKV